MAALLASKARVRPAVLAGFLVATSCGGAATTVSPGADQQQEPGASQTVPVRIRLDLAPDPVWEWMESSGVVSDWEADRNIKLEVTNSFDQFATFAGGHVDMVVINALDVSQFVEQSGREPVIVGKFTTDRSVLAVSRTLRGPETLEDLIEARIAVDSSLGSTLLWGLIAESLYGLDLRVGGSDFDLVVVDPASFGDLVERGDVDACICLPDFSVDYLADGRLRILHDGQSAAEIFAREVLGDANSPPMALAFVVDKPWHDANSRAVQQLLGLWEIGIRQWSLGKNQIIADFPHLLSVESDEQIAWITNYVRENDWVTTSVYLNSEDQAAHSDIFSRMRRVGFVASDAVEPALSMSFSGTGSGG